MTFRFAQPLAMIGLAAGACSASNGYYAPRAQTTAYTPARTTTYATPGGTTVVSTPATAVTTVDPPSYQKSNVYSSRADYERNYQGIHNGPERTGP